MWLPTLPALIVGYDSPVGNHGTTPLKDGLSSLERGGERERGRGGTEKGREGGERSFLIKGDGYQLFTINAHT